MRIIPHTPPNWNIIVIFSTNLQKLLPQGAPCGLIHKSTNLYCSLTIWEKVFRYMTRRVMHSFLCIVLMVVAAFALPGRANADPGCGDFYVLYARRSGAVIGSAEEKIFTASMGSKLTGKSWAWGELGNLNGKVNEGYFPEDSAAYPAVDAWNAIKYPSSVETGVRELIKHLNQRYGNGPGDRNCSKETAILGGESQGADLIGWGLQENPGNVGSLSTAARQHIGAAVLYGDPHYQGNLGGSNCYQPVWAVVRLGLSLIHI